MGFGAIGRLEFGMQGIVRSNRATNNLRGHAQKKSYSRDGPGGHNMDVTAPEPSLLFPSLLCAYSVFNVCVPPELQPQLQVVSAVPTAAVSNTHQQRREILLNSESYRYSHACDTKPFFISNPDRKSGGRSQSRTYSCILVQRLTFVVRLSRVRPRASLDLHST